MADSFTSSKACHWSRCYMQAFRKMTCLQRLSLSSEAPTASMWIPPPARASCMFVGISRVDSVQAQAIDF
jgi:hypothetical protein